MKESRRLNSLGLRDELVNEPPLGIEGRVSKGDLLPNFLMELSDASMRTIRSGDFRLVQTPAFPPEEESVDELQLCLVREDLEDPIPIEPLYEETVIVAVDASSVKVGETGNGIICAIRGAIVWRRGGEISFIRCGPLLFHITNFVMENLHEEKAEANFELKFPVSAVSRLRNLLERSLQGSACRRFEGAILLFDGSLTAGTPDNPSKNLGMILSAARRRRNSVLAISKATRITLSGVNASRLLRSAKAPCLLDIDRDVRASFPNHPVQLLGKVYVAKLSAGGFAFRLDADRNLPSNKVLESVGKLVAIDVVEQGYPDTLRLAHILSSFTASEVIGIQGLLSKNFGLQMLPKVNLRRILFGPFGSSLEVS
ncbi:TPA: DNA double-strand break repair nuclease NurA [Candidatus Bathyarchaeota archaeon]|nr:DNA double-strand break repair nuclease NurA [Candidatus Bathyarchaeota archaeon]